MGALSLVTGGLLAIGGVQPADARIGTWAPQITDASVRFGIPARWIERVIMAESGGRTQLGMSPIRSRVGAIGLMQLMPQTWSEMRAAQHLGRDPDDPHDNILAGTAYLRAMYDRFGYPGLFAAYNAGPARYAASLATGQRLPQETLAYLAAVTGVSPSLPASQRRAVVQRLFVLHYDHAAHPSPEMAPHADALFAVRRDAAPGP